MKKNNDMDAEIEDAEIEDAEIEDAVIISKEKMAAAAMILGEIEFDKYEAPSCNIQIISIETSFGGESLHFDELDYGTQMSFLKAERGNSLANERCRCLFLHLGIAAGLHPFALQWAFRYSADLAMEKYKSDKIPQDVLGALPDLMRSLALGDFVDLNLLNYFCVEELSCFHIWCFSVGRDKNILRTHYPPNNVQEGDSKEIILLLRNIHFTILKPRNSGEFARVNDMKAINRLLDRGYYEPSSEVINEGGGDVMECGTFLLKSPMEAQFDKIGTTFSVKDTVEAMKRKVPNSIQKPNLGRHQDQQQIPKEPLEANMKPDRVNNKGVCDDIVPCPMPALGKDMRCPAASSDKEVPTIDRDKIRRHAEVGLTEVSSSKPNLGRHVAFSQSNLESVGIESQRHNGQNDSDGHTSEDSNYGFGGFEFQQQADENGSEGHTSEDSNYGFGGFEFQQQADVNGSEGHTSEENSSCSNSMQEGSEGFDTPQADILQPIISANNPESCCFNRKQKKYIQQLFKKFWSNQNEVDFETGPVNQRRELMRIVLQRIHNEITNNASSHVQEMFRKATVYSIDNYRFALPKFAVQGYDDISLGLKELDRGKNNYKSVDPNTSCSIKLLSQEEVVMLHVKRWYLQLDDSTSLGLAHLMSLVLKDREWRTNLLYIRFSNLYCFWQLLQQSKFPRTHFNIKTDKDGNTREIKFTSEQIRILKNLHIKFWSEENAVKFLDKNLSQKVYKKILKSHLLKIYNEIKSTEKFFTKFELYQLGNYDNLRYGLEFFALKANDQYYSDVGSDLPSRLDMYDKVKMKPIEQEVDVLNTLNEQITGMRTSEKPQTVSEMVGVIMNDPNLRKRTFVCRFINKSTAKAFLQNHPGLSLLLREGDEKFSKEKGTGGKTESKDNTSSSVFSRNGKRCETKFNGSFDESKDASFISDESDTDDSDYSASVNDINLDLSFASTFEDFDLSYVTDNGSKLSDESIIHDNENPDLTIDFDLSQNITASPSTSLISNSSSVPSDGMHVDGQKITKTKPDGYRLRNRQVPVLPSSAPDYNASDAIVGNRSKRPPSSPDNSFSFPSPSKHSEKRVKGTIAEITDIRKSTNRRREDCSIDIDNSNVVSKVATKKLRRVDNDDKVETTPLVAKGPVIESHCGQMVWEKDMPRKRLRGSNGNTGKSTGPSVQTELGKGSQKGRKPVQQSVQVGGSGDYSHQSVPERHGSDSEELEGIVLRSNNGNTGKSNDITRRSQDRRVLVQVGENDDRGGHDAFDNGWNVDNDDNMSENVTEQSSTSLNIPPILCLEIHNGHQIPLEASINTIKQAIQRIFALKGTEKVKDANDIQKLEDVIHKYGSEVLTPPDEETDVQKCLSTGVLMIGNITKEKTRQKKGIYAAICVLPEKPFICLVTYNKAATNNIYTLIQRIQEKNRMVFKLNGCSSAELFLQPKAIIRPKDQPEKYFILDEKTAALTFGAHEVLTSNAATKTSYTTQLQFPSLVGMQPIKLNDAFIQALNHDEKHYMFKLKIKISRQEQSRSGMRRKSSTFIDLTQHQASKLPLFQMSNLRNIQIANLVNVGLYSKTPEEIVSIFNDVSSGMSESQKDALAAILFTNWMWRIKDSDLVPVRLQKYAIDLDSCAGKGILRVTQLQILSIAESLNVRNHGIWPRSSHTKTALDKVDSFLNQWLNKIVVAMSGSLEDFLSQYKSKQTVFTKRGLWKLGSWGTPMHSGGRSKVVTDALCLPAGCPIGMQDSQVFNAAIRILDRNKDLKPKKKVIFDCAMYITDFIKTRSHQGFDNNYSSSVMENVYHTESFSCIGGPLLTFLSLLLVAILYPQVDIEFSLETYGMKTTQFENLTSQLEDILKSDDALIAIESESIYNKLKSMAEGTPTVTIPKFIELLDKEGLLDRKHRVVSVGSGASVKAVAVDDDQSVYVKYGLVQHADAIGKIREVSPGVVFTKNLEDLRSKYSSSGSEDSDESTTGDESDDENNKNNENGENDEDYLEEELGGAIHRQQGQVEEGEQEEGEEEKEEEEEKEGKSDDNAANTPTKPAGESVINKLFEATNKGKTNKKILDQKRQNFILTKAINDLAVFPIRLGIFPLTLWSNCFQKGLQREQFCRLNPKLKKQFSDFSRHILRIQAYDSAYRCAIGETSGHKQSHHAMNTASAIGQTHRLSSGYLNTEKLVEGVTKFFANDDKFLSKFNSNEISPDARLEITARVDDDLSACFSFELHFKRSTNSLLKLHLALISGKHFSGYKLAPYVNLKEIMSRALRSYTNKTLLLINPEEFATQLPLKRIDLINEFMLCKMMAVRPNLVVMHSGRLALQNPYSMGDAISVALGRPLLPPKILAPKVTEMLLADATEDAVKKLEEKFGMTPKSIGEYDKDLKSKKKFLLCPIITGTEKGLTVFIDPPNPSNTFACKFCHRLFSRTDPQCENKFTYHPCKGGHVPNISNDVIEMNSKEWMLILNASIEEIRSDPDQKLFYDSGTSKDPPNLITVGAAGAGKTKALVAIIQYISTYRGFDAMIIVSFTHNAANLIGGETYHRVTKTGKMGADIYYYIHGSKGINDLEAKVDLFIKEYFIEDDVSDCSMDNILRATYFIIDEIGDLSVDILEFTEALLRKIRLIEKPFGGMKLFLCGDHFQGNIILNKLYEQRVKQITDEESKNRLPPSLVFDKYRFDPFYKSLRLPNWGFKWIHFDPKKTNRRFMTSVHNVWWDSFLKKIRVGVVPDREDIAKFNKIRVESKQMSAFDIGIARRVDLHAIIASCNFNNADLIKWKNGGKEWGTVEKQLKFRFDNNYLIEKFIKFSFEQGINATSVQYAKSFEEDTKNPELRKKFYEKNVIVTQHHQKDGLKEIAKLMEGFETPTFSHSLRQAMKVVIRSRFGPPLTQTLQNQNEINIKLSNNCTQEGRTEYSHQMKASCSDIFKCSVGDRFRLTSNSAGYYMSALDEVTITGFDLTEPSKPKLKVKVGQNGGNQQGLERIIEPVKFEFEIPSKSMNETITMQITQFPLMKASALTTVQARGLTFESLMFFLTMKMNPGEAYIGLSRIRCPTKLWTSHALTEEVVRQLFQANHAAVALENALVSMRVEGKLIEGNFYIDRNNKIQTH